MPLTKEQFEKLHTVKIEEVKDATSRFSYKASCSCGVMGHFFTLQDAEAYKELHLNRKALAPY